MTARPRGTTRPKPGSATAKTAVATAAPSAWVDPWCWIALGVATLVGALLRGARLGELPGGFLAFNEGYYIDAALREASRAPWEWFVHPTLLDKPPLYVGIVQLLYRLHLPEVAAARAVSVLAGTATIVLVFLLARLLFDQRTALASAVAIALMPGAVLVDHNIQVDPLSVTLMLAAIVLYLWALRGEGLRRSAGAGVVLGIAILVKQPAVLALVAIAIWHVWQAGGIAPLKSRRFLTFAGVGMAVGASWYVLQLLVEPGAFIAGMSQTAGRTPLSDLGTGLFWSWNVGSELMWMLFPVAALLALGGLVLMGVERRAGDKFVLVSAGVFFVYYLPFHLHSYYLLPLAPFLALAVGRVLMGGLATRWPLPCVRLGALGVLAACLLLGSLVMLSGAKWGRWSPMSLGASTPAQPYAISTGAAGLFDRSTFNPGSEANNPAEVALPDYLSLPEKDSPDLVAPYGGGAGPAPKVAYEDHVVVPVIFGLAISQRAWEQGDPLRNLAMLQEFTNNSWEIASVGAPWFGATTQTQSAQMARYDRATLDKALGTSGGAPAAAP